MFKSLPSYWQSHPPASSPQPLTLYDKSLSNLTLEQTTILNRETGPQSIAISEICCVSGAEYPNRTLTLNICLKYVKGRTNIAPNFPGLMGKQLFVFADWANCFVKTKGSMWS